MTNGPLSRLHATVEGRVQGVSFRYFVQEQALERGINGWVRNRWNGSVEVTVEGSRDKLEELLQVLRVGPPMARVTNVDFEWLPSSGEFNSFWVKSTG